MTKKTVEEEIPEENATVKVEYEDGEIEKITIQDQGFGGRFKAKTTVQGKHLSTLEKLMENGFPK